MRVAYLELHNYRKFKELKLQFPDGLIGILGMNGAGKTTIIESIAWALFGNVDEVVRTSREGVRWSGAGPSDLCSALLEFEIGGTEYRILREMSGKSMAMRAELRTKDRVVAEGDRPVRKAVEKLLGMDHKSFFTSVFARQKELNALQSVAPGERKKVVLRMLRIDGIDDVLTRIRSDARDVASRIEGAERTLLTDDGREKEKVLKERLPGLRDALAEAQKTVDGAEVRERTAVAQLEAVRAKRDELRKDVEAYNSASSELAGKRATIAEQRAREKSLSEKIAATSERLSRLPELERADDRFREVDQKRDLLEQEREKHERVKAIVEQMTLDEADLAAREAEVKEARAILPSAKKLEEQLDEVERAKLECEAQRDELSNRIGQLKAQIAEKTGSASMDRKKLDEIKLAGKKGVCPTCERALGEAYDLLVSKLSDGIRECEELAHRLEREVEEHQLALASLAKKEEALRKKRARLEQERTKLRQQEASVAEREQEIGKLRERLDSRRRSLAEMGEVRFDEKEYRAVREEHERLRKSHEELVRLRSLKEQADNLARDLANVREALARSAMEEAGLRSVVEALAPKKELYDSAIRELDEKTASVNSAKDALRKAAAVRDRAASDLRSVEKELDEVARVKKAIEADRARADDLALVEEVVANFKDWLIGRIAPTLSEISSRELEAMTEGRYSRVVLDEDYEMRIEDHGQEYPVSRFSGGEADLANLSLRLAISTVISERTGANPVSLMILDEIFGSQDPSRKRSVMTALGRLSTQFRQIFIITHIEDVKDAMSYVIRVSERDDGTSSAELVS